MSKKDTSLQQTPLAIIGIGCLFPQAADKDEYWSNIKRAVDAITEVPESHWKLSDYHDPDPKKPDMTYARRGGFLKPVDFDAAAFGISPNTLEATDSAQLLGLVAAEMALSDAGYGVGRDFDRSRVSVILGVTGALELVVPLGARLGHPIWRKALKEAGIEGERAEAIIERIKDGYVPWQESSFPGLLGNVVAGRIANRFNLGGTNCVVDAACASSLSAVHMAGLELANRRSSMVVTGGADCFNDIFMYMCFSKTPALSPTGDARPFDTKADGTILGEGLGMLVLKRLDDAEKDGDKIYAVIKGVGSSSDGRGKSIYAPSAEGQTKALRQAYQLSGVTPDTIGLVEAHGTGTSAGDAAEVEALRSVYRESGREGVWCALGSVKSMIGHTKAAAGAAGLIKTALALKHKILPPTIKVQEPNPALEGSPFYISSEKRPWFSSHPRRAAVSALGFGGSNFHCVLEEYEAQKTQADWSGDIQLVALNTHSELEWWSHATDWNEIRIRAARSRASFRTDASFRLAFVVEKDRTDLKRLVSSVQASLACGNAHWVLPEGAYFSSCVALPAGLAVLFPGQGSQYVGMGRDLACLFPEAFAVIEQAGPEISQRMFPQPVFDDAARAAQEAALRDTRVAQPALGAAGLAAWRVLQTFGVKASAFAGHSYGELAALCAAGRIDSKSLFELSALRGRLMAEGDGGRGGMLAVQAPLSELEKLLKDARLDLVLANKNAPNQGVLSGRKEEIARAAAILEKRGLRAVVLPVSAAFHSALVEGAAKPFRAALEKVSFVEGRAPVYANKTAQPYPRVQRDARDLLAAQLSSPVEFAAMITNMYAGGCRFFLEVGAGARLTGLVSQVLEGKDFQAISVDSGGKRNGVTDLARALAALAAYGHGVDLKPWEGGEEAVKHLVEKKKPKMAVTLTGSNYRSTPPKNVPIPAASAGVSANGGAPAAHRMLAEALRASQESLAALQRMQEQTAQLHVKFLELQEAAQRSFQSLVEQQQRMHAQWLGGPLPASQAVVVAQPAQPPAVVVRPPAVGPSVGIESVLLSVVSEKTGYPAEALNVDMDLEADLGIDSIKRVEIMSAIAEKLPDAPKVKPEHLGTLRTLRQIAKFLSEGTASDTAVAVSTPASTTSVEAVLLAVVSEKTGYPAEALNVDMDLEADLGIDSIKRVEIMSAIAEKLPDAPKVKPEHLGTLRTLRQIAAFLASAAGSAAAAVTAKPGTDVTLKRMTVKAAAAPPPGRALSLAQAPIAVADCAGPFSRDLVRALEAKGVSAIEVSLTGAGLPQRLAGLVIPAAARTLTRDGLWDEASETFLADALMLAKAAATRLTIGRSFFATVSRLDGCFGLTGLKSEHDPIAGGLAGLSKTAAKEWEGVTCRALDAAADLAGAASAVADELLREGPLELGLSSAGRQVLVAHETEAEAGEPPLKNGDVVLVTGGARGITAACAVAMAEAFQPTLVLVGRTELGAEEAPLGSSEADIKKALIARHPGLTPKAIGALCAKVLAEREIRDTLKRIEAAGAKAVYMAADIRDEKSVRALVSRVVMEHGSIRGLVHGAGVLADKRIADKVRDGADAVIATKLAGLRHVLRALDLSRLKAVALFSSTTARFGRIAQADYAMANEALNKTAQLLSRRLLQAKVVSFGWGPWDGGMVTEGLKKMFASEGMAIIDLRAGARFMVDELCSRSRAVEVTVLAQAGRFGEEELPLVYERDVSVEEFPFLASHVINGHPVLPLAITAEMLAHAALHGNPGLVFHGFDDLRVLKGVLINGKPLRLSIHAGKAIKKDGFFAAETQLRGENGVLHVKATVVLAAKLPTPPTPAPATVLTPYARSVDRVYQEILFHGPDLRFLRTVIGASDEAIAGEAAAAAPPATWLKRPWRDRWVSDPAALDAAFQLMILWTQQTAGFLSLPSFAARYRQYKAFPVDGTRLSARAFRRAEGLACADIDFTDASGALVARLEGYECTMDASLGEAFRRNAVQAAA